MSTLAQLRLRVRYNLGEPSGEQRFYNVSINANLNESYRYYLAQLIDNGESNFTTTVSIDFVANQAEYALPSDWVKTRMVDRVTTFGTVPLERFERYETTNITIGGNAGDWFLPSYRFRGQNLVFEPKPTFSQVGAVIHEYYAEPANLVADGDSPSTGFIETWQDMMVIRATLSELENKDAVGGVSDINSFRLRLQNMEEAFRKLMTGRSQARDKVERYGYDYYDNYNVY